MKKEKKFTKPEAELVKFFAEDIIVTSANDDPWDEEYEQGGIGGGQVPHP